MSPLRIFLVDNHPLILSALSSLLEEQGHHVETAASFAAATQKLLHLEIDLLLCDLKLPDGSGWELLRQLPSRPFAVAMSGYAKDADFTRSRAAGFRYHLLKPFSAEDLLPILKEVQALKRVPLAVHA